MREGTEHEKPEDKYAEFIAGLTEGVDLRGQCGIMSAIVSSLFPELRRVRGHYYCPIAGRERTHWWCVAPDGSIVDPTASQFPSAGAGEYREYDGPEPSGKCLYCGDLVLPPRRDFCEDECAELWRADAMPKEESHAD